MLVLRVMPSPSGRGSIHSFQWSRTPFKRSATQETPMLATVLASCLVSAAPARLINLKVGSTYQWQVRESSTAYKHSSYSVPEGTRDEGELTWKVVD